MIVEVGKTKDMATALIGFRAGWDGKAIEDVKATLLLTIQEIDRATVKAA